MIKRKSVSQSSAWATAPRRWCRVCSSIKNAKDDDHGPGLMHVNLGGYHVRDIEFTAAFDVVDTKVGKDLSEAIFAYPNNTFKFADVPIMNVRCTAA